MRTSLPANPALERHLNLLLRTGRPVNQAAHDETERLTGRMSERESDVIKQVYGHLGYRNAAVRDHFERWDRLEQIDRVLLHNDHERAGPVGVGLVTTWGAALGFSIGLIATMMAGGQSAEGAALTAVGGGLLGLAFGLSKAKPGVPRYGEID